MKLHLICAAALVLGTPLFARVGETESQLLRRFGPPIGNQTHVVSAHGLALELGTSLTFVTGDWTITCDVIDGMCARISYSRIGPWAEEDFQTLLSANAQSGKWTELLSPNVKQIVRKWKRDDGLVAHWVMGTLTLTSPLYERSKAIAEEKARAAEKNARNATTS